MRTFKKKPELRFVVLPGIGRVDTDRLLEGDHLAKFVPSLLVEVPALEPASPRSEGLTRNPLDVLNRTPPASVGEPDFTFTVRMAPPVPAPDSVVAPPPTAPVPTMSIRAPEAAPEPLPPEVEAPVAVSAPQVESPAPEEKPVFKKPNNSGSGKKGRR